MAKSLKVKKAEELRLVLSLRHRDMQQFFSVCSFESTGCCAELSCAAVERERGCHSRVCLMIDSNIQLPDKTFAGYNRRQVNNISLSLSLSLPLSPLVSL